MLLVMFYFLIQFGLTIIMRKARTAPDYVVAEGQARLIPLAASLVGTTVGGGMFLGFSLLAFDNPVAAISISVTYLMGSVMIGFLSPFFRQYALQIGATSPHHVVESLDKQSGGKFASIFELVQLAVYIIMLAAQFVSMMAFFSYLQGKDDNFAYLLGIGCVIALLISYAYSGGLRRDIASDLLQFVFLLLGAVAIMSLKILPDSAAITISQQSLSPTIGTLALCFFVLVSLLPTFVVRFDIWQRVLAAESDRSAKWAFILSGITSSVFFVIFGLAGVLAAARGISRSSYVGLDYLLDNTSDIYHGLIFVCFFAAVMSSADTFLGVSGLSLNGVLQKFKFVPSGIFGINISVFITGAVAAAIAYWAGDIVMLFSSAFAMLSAFAPPFLIDFRGQFGVLKYVTRIVLASLGLFAVVFVFSPSLAFAVPFIVSLLISVGVAWKNSVMQRHP
jgi:Na+/proline symporter